jgi:hypothetical protein
VWKDVLPTIVQVVSTAVIGVLVWTLRHARKEVSQFMTEHDTLLTSARNNAAAIIKLSKRLDRHVRGHG